MSKEDTRSTAILACVQQGLDKRIEAIEQELQNARATRTEFDSYTNAAQLTYQVVIVRLEALRNCVVQQRCTGDPFEIMKCAREEFEKLYGTAVNTSWSISVVLHAGTDRETHTPLTEALCMTLGSEAGYPRYKDLRQQVKELMEEMRLVPGTT